MAFGGAIVPKINIILSLLCERYFASKQLQALPIVIGGDNEQCQIPEVHELVSSFMLVASAVAGIISAIIAPLLGSYSDRHGRVQVIAFTASGSIIADLITIAVARYSDVLSVYWLLAAYVIEAFTGTFIASIALTYAYASDCTDPRKRSVVFGYVQGGLFTGIALGPLFASYLVKVTHDLVSVIYVQVAAHTFFVLWNTLVVPESLTKERQFVAQEKYQEEQRRAAALAPPARGGAWGHLGAVGGGVKRFFHGDFFNSLGVLWPTGAGTTAALRRNLVLLAGIDTCMFAVGMGLFTVLVLYAEKAFHWGNFETQMFTAAINIVRVCLLLGGLPLVARLRPRPAPSAAAAGQAHAGADGLDLAVIRASVVFDLLGYVGFGLAQSGPAFLAAGVFAAFGSMASPTLASALTKHVPPDRIGRLLGATALLHAVARVGGPALFNGVYYLTVKHFPQTIFVVLVALFSLVVAGSWFLTPNGESFPLWRVWRWTLTHCQCILMSPMRLQLGALRPSIASGARAKLEPAICCCE